jgi:hypothetical protein
LRKVLFSSQGDVSSDLFSAEEGDVVKGIERAMLRRLKVRIV